jgi:menaquinone-dependent protoporphyrinogen oxidase
MKPILVLYATREGQTRRIAEHLAATARARNLTAEVVDAKHLSADFSLDSYSAAVLAASVHMQKHEPEMKEFVKRHLASLQLMPAVFLSVSLSEAGAEDPAATPARRAQSAADANKMIQAFLTETGWHPSHLHAVAGALMYTKYNFLIRFVMKRIARQAGASTDTSHDHDYTDWEGLDRILDELGSNVPPSEK